MTRVVFAGGGTGGHLYPALALADAMRRERGDVEPFFVGAERGVEARVLPEKGVDHVLLPIEPIYRDRIWRNIRLVSSLGGTVSELSSVFDRLRPALVVGTGGYASGPACGWALIKGVPVALQEQNSYPGLTTRWLSRWARQIHLGFPEAEQYLSPSRKTRVFALGNPIQPPDRSIDRAEARRSFALDPGATVVLVVGGSQGARAINGALTEAVERVRAGTLPAPPEGLQILWATGPTHIEGVQERLRAAGSPAWVHAVGYIDRMPEALASADIAVSRAGAMGTAELLAWGIPALLVPLPTAAANHQVHNAEALAKAGAAVSLPESQLTPERLWSELRSLAGDAERRDRMAERARERARPDAAQAIAQRLLALVEAA